MNNSQASPIDGKPAVGPAANPLPAETDQPFGIEKQFDEPLDAVELVRVRLDIDASVSDVTIAASLAQIATRPDQRERWLAAFASPLGKHLAAKGTDLSTAIDNLLALAPRQNG